MFEAKLLLRAGLIRAVKVHEYLISLRSSYEPTLNGSSALQCFEHGNAVEIHNEILFDFYPGLQFLYNLMLWQQAKVSLIDESYER